MTINVPRNVKVSTFIKEVVKNLDQRQTEFDVYTDHYGQMIYMSNPQPQKITIVTDGCGNITIYAA